MCVQVGVIATYPILDFEDALTVAHTQRKNATQVASYDHGFDRVKGIQRTES